MSSRTPARRTDRTPTRKTPARPTHPKGNVEKSAVATHRKEDKENLDIMMDTDVFQDEADTLEAHACSNYFLQGKLVQMNAGRRKQRKTKSAADGSTDDEEEVSGDSKYAVCDLPKLRDYSEIAHTLLPRGVTDVDAFVKDGFPMWRVYLAAGFNLLVHGAGSKKRFIAELAKQYHGYCTFVVDGFREEATIRNILTVLDEKLGIKAAASVRRSSAVWASAIVSELAKRKKQMIMLINNIDGPHFREPSDQDIFRIFAQSSEIRLVASIDHVNATAMWNTRQLSSFNWVHIRVDTFDVPIAELFAGQSKLLGLSQKSSQTAHSLSSLDVFWQSLADNSRKIFRIFFAMTHDSGHAVPFWDLFEEARNNFLVSTDAVLRQQLVEFEDHRIISRRRREDGNELLASALDMTLVEKFLQEKGLNLDL